MLQPNKCEFVCHEVAYLGHIIGENGVRPDPQKVSAVRNFPTTKNIKNFRQFLGLADYYCRFISDFTRIANLQSNLLKKDVPFIRDFEDISQLDIRARALCDVTRRKQICTRWRIKASRQNYVLSELQ